MPDSDPQAETEERMVADTQGCGPQSGVDAPSNPPESRELDEKLLDEGQLRLHFSHLEHVSERMEVSIKRSAEAPPERAQLEELILPLVKSKVFGAQVQYLSDGRLWLDTFVSTRGGVRWVRLQLAG
jgi:hypothetical protein